MSIVSRNTFGPNDTITITFSPGSELASTDPSNILLDNILVTSYQTDIQNLNTIVLSSFTFISTNYAPLYGTLTINKIVQAVSTKPRVNNVIELRRNGYLYGRDTFGYAVNGASMSSMEVVLGNNYANSDTNCTWKLVLSKGVVQGDRIYMNIPSAISVSTCQPQCVGCSCNIALPTIYTPYTQLSISIPSISTPLLSLNIITNHRNPISPISNITSCTTDA